MTTPAVAERAACTACGASVRVGDPWCTLCYADLTPRRPDPSGPDAAASEPSAAPATIDDDDPVTAPTAAPEPESEAETSADGSPLDGVTMPCSTCESPVPIRSTLCPICGTDLLAPLRGSARTHANPLVRELMGMSRGARMGAAGALACLLLVLLFGISNLIG